MRWSRLARCAAITAVTTVLTMRGTSPWLTVPLGAFAAWWTYECTRALWSLVSFRVAVWRAYLLSPLEDFTRRKRKRLWWLAAVDIATIVGVLVFPALL